jgi:DNA-binding response OmpR family regulator
MKEEIDVLLVDDDTDICLMMESILKFSGYKVQSCSAAEQLMQVLDKIDPRLILMDMFLSGKDGRDLCKNLKSDHSQPVKIIMMSAHPDGEITCMEAGADAFLPKPFDIDSLITKVQSVLNN